jgi:thiol-disulfide isomerase/thioredoxin
VSEDDPAAGIVTRRASAPAILLALFLLSAFPLEAGLPVTLTDPATGAEVRIEPGAAALHVVFFATWCLPCVEELDALAELEARWESRGYRLVLVAVENRHTRERLVRFAAEDEPPGRLLFDSDGSADSNLRVSELPTHLLFDAEGREKLRAANYDGDVAAAVASLVGAEGGRGR